MTADLSIAVRAAGLVKRFGEVRALNGVNFDVSSGQIFGLVGPDGAGKTTTLRILAGLLRPDEGFAMVAGHDVVRDAEALREDISYMPQRFGLYEELSVDENIRFHADLFGVARRLREERATQLLKACGMIDFRRRLAGRLSGGMKQKLSLVCALIHEPRILLLDEPTSGVDPVSRREFWTMLYDLVGSGVTVIVSTAYLDEAERCHRLGLIYKGRLLLCDTPENLKKRMAGEVISIVSPTSLAVEKALAANPTFARPMVVGNEVHLLVNDAAQGASAVRAQLEAMGCAYDEIISVVPSIEDLFVNAVTAEAQSSSP